MCECREERCGWTGDTPDEDASAAQYCPECGGDLREVCTDTAADEDRVISAAEEVIRPRTLN
jgi:transcription initiation factor IIE alpha subunit